MLLHACLALVPGSALRGPNGYLRYVSSPHPLPLKQALSQLAAQTVGGAAATAADAAEAAELVALLEAAAKPVRSWPARGPAMEGAWDQVYTDNANAGAVFADGSLTRRALKGPLSGRVQQVVSYEPPFGREIPPKFT